jgi:hypothetical protein
MKGVLKSFFSFYRDGFRNMPLWGRSVWMVIIVKLFIMFAILRIFFFPDLLKRDFESDDERSRYMIEQLTEE